MNRLPPVVCDELYCNGRSMLCDRSYSDDELYCNGRSMPTMHRMPIYSDDRSLPFAFATVIRRKRLPRVVAALMHERGRIVESLAIGDLLGQLRDDRVCLPVAMLRQLCQQGQFHASPHVSAEVVLEGVVPHLYGLRGRATPPMKLPHPWASGHPRRSIRDGWRGRLLWLPMNEGRLRA